MLHDDGEVAEDGHRRGVEHGSGLTTHGIEELIALA